MTSNRRTLVRVVSSVLAASALVAAAPALAIELAASRPEPRRVPACCEDAAGAPSEAPCARARQVAPERPLRARQPEVTVDDPFSRHPYWEGP